MLSKQYRLTVPEFFRNANPAKRFTSQFVLVSVKSSHQPISRFGIMVPKRLDKRSSQRNSLRRMVVVSIQAVINSIQPNKDVLIKLNRVVKKEDRELFYNELTKTFKNAGIL